ncbi:MAG: Coenzyme F420 hydrogenase/dehydrogenase, beta subunit C-terminal domain, partial [Pseudomonadota bacterium]
MADTSPALARVARGDLCSGCGGCAAVAPDKISMKVAGTGFLRPQQSSPLSDAEEDLIAAICPGLGQKVVAGENQKDPLWGAFVSMQVGWSTDEPLRFRGSSGGALSMMLVHLLEEGIIDAVIQTAASPDLVIGNTTVVTTSVDEISKAAGSRYAPSAPLDGLSTHLATGKRFAFVGKPCDVAALRAWMAQDPRISTRIPVLLSFFCAGVPSHKGGEAVLAKLGATLAEAKAFRYRGNGWPGTATVTLEDGTQRGMTYHESWGGVLSKHVQNRCKICADGTGKAADIVCADAWECDAQGYPVFDEAPGISLIVARTTLGAQLISAAKDAGRIATESFDVRELAAIQPGQRERRRALLARLIG